MMSAKNNPESQKVESKNSVNWNHIDSILNQNEKIPTRFTLIQITLTQINSIQMIQKTSGQSTIQPIFMR